MTGGASGDAAIPAISQERREEIARIYDELVAAARSDSGRRLRLKYHALLRTHREVYNRREALYREVAALKRRIEAASTILLHGGEVDFLAAAEAIDEERSLAGVPLDVLKGAGWAARFLREKRRSS